MLNPQICVKTVTQAVSFLKMKETLLKQPKSAKPTGQTTGYVGKSLLGKPRPSQLSSGANGLLNPESFCQHCKDTTHLKENCI